MNNKNLQEFDILRYINHDTSEQKSLSYVSGFSERTVRNKLNKLLEEDLIYYYRDNRGVKQYLITPKGENLIKEDNRNHLNKRELHRQLKNNWIQIKGEKGESVRVIKFEDEEKAGVAGYSTDDKIIFIIYKGNLKETVEKIRNEIIKNKEVELLANGEQLKTISKEIAVITNKKYNEKYNNYHGTNIEIDYELKEKFSQKQGFLFLGTTVEEIEEDRVKQGFS